MTSDKASFGGKRILEGTVVSDKMEKTVIVTVRSSGRHRLYKKIVRRVKRFTAHDDKHDAHTGDIVRIVEAPPRSRKKRWEVVEVLFRADLPEVAAESIDLDLIGEVKIEKEETDETKAPAAAGQAEEASHEAEAEVEAPVAEEQPEEPPVVEEAVPEVAEEPEDAPAEAKVEATAEAPAEVEVESEVDDSAGDEAPDFTGAARHLLGVAQMAGVLVGDGASDDAGGGVDAEVD